uniref:Uncharacterized protein n=1 Tax=Timema cristinae TaxID=61476 RepID=A0A7R9H3V4_TIMCR|nr:unnamed protein product [Timema cristinae]
MCSPDKNISENIIQRPETNPRRRSTVEADIKMEFNKPKWLNPVGDLEKNFDEFQEEVLEYFEATETGTKPKSATARQQTFRAANTRMDQCGRRCDVWVLLDKAFPFTAVAQLEGVITPTRQLRFNDKSFLKVRHVVAYYLSYGEGGTTSRALGAP